MTINTGIEYACIKPKTTSKGTLMATVFGYPIQEDGSVDEEQMKLICFDEALINKLSAFKKGTRLVMSLEIKDAIASGVSVIDDDY